MDAFVTRKRPRKDDVAENPIPTRNSSISPPPKRKPVNERKTVDEKTEVVNLTKANSDEKKVEDSATAAKSTSNFAASPFQLNCVRDLPLSNNVDTLKLTDVLGNPMLKECWLFNYLFDIDFVMKQFDPDIRDLVRIRVVHGSWKAEDRNGIGIIVFELLDKEGARRYGNMRVIRAHMPEPFGTHHSKIIVLFRQDNLAQIVILTGNFIERDWSMSQAIWRSPLLPLLREEDSLPPWPGPLGSGSRFKHDVLSYFRGYGPDKLQNLVNQLQGYDFSEVRGALIASLPGKQNIQSMNPEYETLWGWPALKHILSSIQPCPSNDSEKDHQPHVVGQISSVAAMGEKWLTSTFLPALHASPHIQSKSQKPKTSIIFPTADEIRRSVDGYAAGASIHMKTSNPAQKKQLDYLRPMLCHWAGDHKPSVSSFFNKNSTSSIREAGRRRAAPHIKTYIRFSDAAAMNRIDWAMVTSANLSTQAWGAALGAGGEVRICSYEIGVVVWPALWDEDGESGSTVMVPVFKKDRPEGSEGTQEDGEAKKVVGLRMPYDLPLKPYRQDEMPWSAEVPCKEPDWKGQVWPGYVKVH
ncbi:hypothetical protein ACLMJK_005191 [Lecanora helva]